MWMRMLYDVTNSLVIVSFDILKLKFDFIGGELWFVKVKRFKMKERTTSHYPGKPAIYIPAGSYLRK